MNRDGTEHLQEQLDALTERVELLEGYVREVAARLEATRQEIIEGFTT
jgi:hypothetical protein